MASTKKSAKQPARTTVSSPTFTEYRLRAPLAEVPQPKPRIMSSHRTSLSNMPKSSLSYPTTIPNSTADAFRSNYYLHYQQHGEKLLYVFNPPPSSRRITSARASNGNFTTLPINQQPQLLSPTLLPRPHPQYSHFLAYLRRQSLARLRRKQEQEAGNTDTIEATIKLNSNKPSTQSLQSRSNSSLGTSILDVASMSSISLTAKRRTRPTSAYHRQRRPSSSMQTNYRLSLNQSPLARRPPPSTPSTQTPRNNPSNDPSTIIPPQATNTTPANSVIEETAKLPSIKAPYELELSGDMLNYCYVSDSGVKYQGQLLCTSV